MPRALVMIKRILIVLLLLLALFGIVFGWKYHQIQHAMAQRQAPPPPVVAVSEARE